MHIFNRLLQYDKNNYYRNRQFLNPSKRSVVISSGHSQLFVPPQQSSINDAHTQVSAALDAH